MELAINGGKPYRETVLQYGKQTIDESDKEAVMEVLNENKFLTTGPRVNKFEEEVCEFVGSKYGVAVNSGTAALHCALSCLNLQSDDEIIVTSLSFVASANAILYCGAKPVFCDIEESTMNIDVDKIEELITEKTRGIVFVDFAGQPCDFHRLKEIKEKYNLVLIEDAAHSIGCQINKCPNKPYIGSFADLTTFSFHPVKNITTCEGGMIMTNNEDYYNQMKSFRSHGISVDYKQREKMGSHYYEMTQLGYNYRIPDLLCALGSNQLKRLPQWIKRRQEIAKRYDEAFGELSKYFEPLEQKYESAYHIYVIKLKLENLKVSRDEIFKALKAEGLGVNVDYMPIHLHPYYKKNLGTEEGLCPVSDNVYKRIITLPIFPTMTEEDIEDVIGTINKVINFYKK